MGFLGTSHGRIMGDSCKKHESHLRKVASNVKFTFEEFTTLLARIESILNSRPLSAIREDPTTIISLTPGHL